MKVMKIKSFGRPELFELGEVSKASAAGGTGSGAGPRKLHQSAGLPDTTW